MMNGAMKVFDGRDVIRSFFLFIGGLMSVASYSLVCLTFL
jgi:hypothetical protein